MADSPTPARHEARLLLPNATDLRAIAHLTHLGPHPLRLRGIERRHSTYLDTPSLTLARHGVALQLRRRGRQWDVIVGLAGCVEGGVNERPGLTVALPRAPDLPFVLPPGPLHTRLAALAARRPLTPILTCQVYRRLFDVLPPDAPVGPEPIAELALYRIRVRTPQEGQPETTYYEVEVACHHGEQADIKRLARLLRHGFNLEPSNQPAFARGVTHLYGPGIIGTGDQRVLAYDTVQEAARHVLARHLHRLRLHDPGTRVGEDPEALHDMRVATRRLRAAVRIFAAGIPARLQGALNQELRWLGEVLGKVRDLDVQLAKLDSFVTAAPAGFRPALACLQEYLKGERTRQRADMLVGLDTARYFRLLTRLERFAYGRASRRSGDAAAQEPIAAAGRRAIKKAFRRLIKRGEQIQAMPRPEDLHALRIRAKRLRYLLEFLQELTGKPSRRLVKRLTELQDLLGSYHDAVVAADVVRVYVDSNGAHLAPTQMVALGALVASELRLAEQNRAAFETTWRRFARPRSAKDCRAVLRKLRVLQPSSDARVQEPQPEPLPQPQPESLPPPVSDEERNKNSGSG